MLGVSLEFCLLRETILLVRKGRVGRIAILNNWSCRKSLFITSLEITEALKRHQSFLQAPHHVNSKLQFALALIRAFTHAQTDTWLFLVGYLGGRHMAN